MKTRKPTEAYRCLFTTSQFSTGALFNATGTPVATARKNGADDAAFVFTVTNMATGIYEVSGTVPGGYSNRDVVQVRVTATVDAVAAGGIVDEFMVVSKDEADITADLVVIGGFVDTEVAAIKAKTDNLPADPAGLTNLAAAHGAGSWQSEGGAGAVSQTFRIKDSSGALVDGAEVWITSDAAGANVVAGTLHSNAGGLVTFMLDPGTYYVWAQRAGVNFTNPMMVTV